MYSGGFSTDGVAHTLKTPHNMDATKQSAQLLGSFIQEFFGSLLMFTLTMPIPAFLGDTWTSWLSHFVAVIMLDILTGGAHVNPAVSVAFWVLGDASLLGLAAKLLGQIAAGSLAFPLLRFLLPPYVQLGGPSLAPGLQVVDGALIEGTLAAVLLFAIFVTSTYIGQPAQRPVMALVIRAIILAGAATTGPAVNPMIAFAWASFVNEQGWLTYEHCVVYWIAPIVGAVLATLMWGALQTAITHSKKSKRD